MTFIILLCIAYVGIQYRHTSQTFTDKNHKKYSFKIIIWYSFLLFIKHRSKFFAYQWDFFYRYKLNFCQLFGNSGCRISLMVSEQITTLILEAVLPSKLYIKYIVQHGRNTCRQIIDMFGNCVLITSQNSTSIFLKKFKS